MDLVSVDVLEKAVLAVLAKNPDLREKLVNLLVERILTRILDSQISAVVDVIE